MKYFLLLVFTVCSVIACKVPKFSYQHDSWIDSLKDFDTVTIDNSYDLYVRHVVKKLNQSTNEFEPVNAPAANNDTIIEIEYLFKSNEHKKVIVLNNVPNNYIKLYSAYNVFSLTGGIDTMEINIFYLRQFRFGSISEMGEIEFTPKDDTSVRHIWNKEEKADNSLLFKSITVRDVYGDQVRNINQAFALDVVYRRVPAFKLVFDRHVNDSSKIVLGNNTFYVVKPKRKYWVIFRFAENIKSSFTNIGFKNRLYTTPPK